jgi:DNA-binding MarR family transcriptional regulator
MVESADEQINPDEAVERDLVDELAQVAFAVIAVLTRVGAQHDLSLTQIRMLGILRDRQPGVTELAGHLGLEKSTVSGLVDRAIRRGLLVRDVDPADGRAVRVKLSAQGTDLAHRLEETVATLLSPLISGLNRTERRRLQDLLSRIDRTVG